MFVMNYCLSQVHVELMHGSANRCNLFPWKVAVVPFNQQATPAWNWGDVQTNSSASLKTALGELTNLLIVDFPCALWLTVRACDCGRLVYRVHVCSLRPLFSGRLRYLNGNGDIVNALMTVRTEILNGTGNRCAFTLIW